MPPPQRPAPARHHASFDGQQPKQAANRLSQSGEQARQGQQGVVSRQEAVQSGEGHENAAEREQAAGYVDIPRRIAWERLCSPGRKSFSLQVSSC